MKIEHNNEFLFKFQDEVYGRITAGYLEPMFAGISSEILSLRKKLCFWGRN